MSSEDNMRESIYIKLSKLDKNSNNLPVNSLKITNPKSHTIYNPYIHYSNINNILRQCPLYCFC